MKPKYFAVSVLCKRTVYFIITTTVGGKFYRPRILSGFSIHTSSSWLCSLSCVSLHTENMRGVLKLTRIKTHLKLTLPRVCAGYKTIQIYLEDAENNED